MTTPTITIAKGGTAERTIKLEDVRVPDMWHVAHELPPGEMRDATLECWRLAHALLAALREVHQKKGGRHNAR